MLTRALVTLLIAFMVFANPVQAVARAMHHGTGTTDMAAMHDCHGAHNTLAAVTFHDMTGDADAAGDCKTACAAHCLMVAIPGTMVAFLHAQALVEQAREAMFRIVMPAPPPGPPPRLQV